MGMYLGYLLVVVWQIEETWCSLIFVLVKFALSEVAWMNLLV